MNQQNFKNGNAMFPISTDALEFMQQQTFLVARLTELAGSYVIISQPANGKPGLCVFNGELLPLTGDTTASHISVSEVKTDITAHGTTYKDARVTREAVYGTSGAPASSFVVLDNMAALKSAIANLTTELNTEGTTRAQHDVPKGTIIDWYGTCKCDQVPYGWIPCGLFFKGNSDSFSAGNMGWVEMEKWKKKYSNITIEVATRDGSYFGIYISYCMGQSIPDLTDRFIVQAGFGYELGETGGARSISLQANQIPAHRHVYNVNSNAIDRNTYKGMGREESGSLGQYSGEGNGTGGRAYTSYAGAGCGKDGKGDANSSEYASYHENRPPFFALYKLIKVI